MSPFTSISNKELSREQICSQIHDFVSGEWKTINSNTGVLDLKDEIVHIWNNSLLCVLSIGPTTWKNYKRKWCCPNQRIIKNMRIISIKVALVLEGS